MPDPKNTIEVESKSGEPRAVEPKASPKAQAKAVAAEQTEAKAPPHVYTAISQVAGKLATEGISKARTASTGGQGSYKFRGIDDVYNALAPYLAEAGLCILPRVLERDQVERVSGKGNALFYTTLKMEFAFVSAKDGSSHTVSTYGEAMDSGDKSTNKAMSAAYKYACMQAFCIPTEGDNDSENQTHEVQGRHNGNGNGHNNGNGQPNLAQGLAVLSGLAKQVGDDVAAMRERLDAAAIVGKDQPKDEVTAAQIDAAIKFYRGLLAEKAEAQN